MAISEKQELKTIQGDPCCKHLWEPWTLQSLISVPGLVSN